MRNGHFGDALLDGAPLTRVRWPTYVRMINSAYPPIDLFEDIADPADWAILGSAESRTNPRLSETIGNLDLVPLDRRVGGPGATYVMAPFTHCSPDKPGRFHDGGRGAFYGAANFETAVAETAHHAGLYYSETNQRPGWITKMRELTGSLDAVLVDIRGPGFDAVLDPDSYVASNAFANGARAATHDGIVYPSVRNAGSDCFAAFYPDVAGLPVQGRHFSYHFNGTRIDLIRELTLNGEGKIYEIIE
jgi:hypothetical protein